MDVLTKNAVGVDEIVIESGGDGSRILAAKPKLKRVAFAKGMHSPNAELVERYESILDAYTAKLKDRIDLNIKKAIELREKGPQPGLEIAEPYSGPLYKWWDLFVIGPIQNITTPPYLPHKIIAAGEPAFFLVFVVKNPLPSPGPGPSALTLMNGRPFDINAEMVNLTLVADGPDINMPGVFNGAMIQPYLLVFNAPAPAQGKPHLYEVNITLDVNDPFSQPIAGFATTFLDIDVDPGFPVGPPHGWQVKVEQPVRFLAYLP